MFFYWPVFVYSLFFLIGLQVANSIKRGTGEFVVENRWLSGFLATILLFALFYWYKRTIRKTSLLIIPVVFTFSSLLLLYLADRLTQEQVLIWGSTLLFYVMMMGAYRLRNYEKDLTARGLIAGTLAATMFFFYSAVYGIYLNFSLPLWLFSLVYFGGTFLASFQFFLLISQGKIRKAAVYAFVIGVSMTEILFLMSFWPFSYLTAGVIALIFYYILWELAQSYFLHQLSQRRLIKNLIFFTILIALILASSRWYTVV